MSKSEIYNQLVNTPVNGLFGIDLGQDKLDEGRPSPVVQGEDGQMYRSNAYLDENGNWQINPDFSTPVYYFHQPLEAGDARGNYAEYSEDLQSADQQGYWKTEEEIKAYWDGEGATDMNIFKQTNPDMDFDTYMSFIKENSALHGQGITPESDPETFAGITEKYGIQTSTTDNDNVYGWNGSNYTKTFKPDDPEYGRMLWGAAAGLMGAQALAPVIGGFTGAAPAGFVGPPTVGNVIGGKVATGVAAGAANAATQAALTGSVDPKSVLSSAVIAGVDPGGMLSDNLGKITGTGTNLVPENVVGGFVQGATNSSVGQLITDGSVDLESALIAGGLSAGVNVVKDLFNDTDQFSIESEMQRIADERAAKNLDPLSYEELYFAATGENPNFLTAENTSNSMVGPPDYSGGTLVGKSDLAGLVGKDGLLSFIPEVPTGWLNNITGGGAYDPTSVFIGPDGKQYTDIELYQQGINPADVYYGELPGWTSATITTENTLIGDAVDYLTDEAPVISQVVKAGNTALDVLADAEFESKYGINADAYIAAGGSAADLQRIISYGELDETYNFSTNPRGDSQYVGLLTGINDGFSAGSNNANRVYTDDGQVISDALEISNMQDASDAAKDAIKAGGNSNVIVNLDGETTVVDGNAVLPGSNTTVADAVLQGIIDGVLVSDDDLIAGTVPGGEDETGSTISTTGSESENGTTSGSTDTVAANTTDTANVNTTDTVTTDDTVDSTNAIAGGDLNTGGNSDDLDTGVDTGDVLSGSDTDTIIDTNTIISGSDDLPTSTSSSGGGGIPIPNFASSGLPVIFGDLFPYTKFRGYSKKRLKLYENMMKGLGATGFFAQASAMSPMERELYEAGELKR